MTLKFRGQQASVKNLLQASEALYSVLFECSEPNLLDAKLAEYAFFPLSNVFNEAQRLSSRCLEVAVRSLHILVLKGWQQNLRPDMGKQLLILMTLLAGRSQAQSQDQPPSEELVCACFECMTTLVGVLGRLNQNVFDETGAKTIVDQSVYMLLEAITDNPSEVAQFSAIFTLNALLAEIRSRVVLASLLPRTVSALTKVVVPTTQMRRRGRILTASLDLLNLILKKVLADSVALGNHSAQSSQNAAIVEKKSEEALVLDEKWLKATASQIKLAFTNVVKHRSHERQEVRDALSNLCLMVCEDCPKTLTDSLPLMLNTAVMLADPLQESPNRNFHTLKHLVLSNSDFQYLIRDSLNSWINALPRAMQGSDDRPKCLLLRQISTAMQIVTEFIDSHGLSDDGFAMNLIESISAEVEASNKKPLQAITDGLSTTQLARIDEASSTLR